MILKTASREIRGPTLTAVVKTIEKFHRGGGAVHSGVCDAVALAGLSPNRGPMPANCHEGLQARQHLCRVEEIL
jgi:hypothetical protein